MATQQTTKSPTEENGELQDSIATKNAAMREKTAQLTNVTSASELASLRSEIEFITIERDRAIRRCIALRPEIAAEEVEKFAKEAREHQDAAALIREKNALEERVRQLEAAVQQALFDGNSRQRNLHDAEARLGLFRSNNKRDVVQREAEEREFRQRLERL